MFEFRAKILMVAATALLFAVMPVQAVLDDPTQPPSGKANNKVPHKKSNKPQWVLSSTLVSAGRRSAVINDRVVVRGDRVGGARVMSIMPSSVTLRVNGRDITLVMLKKNIKSLSQVASSRQGK